MEAGYHQNNQHQPPSSLPDSGVYTLPDGSRYVAGAARAGEIPPDVAQVEASMGRLSFRDRAVAQTTVLGQSGTRAIWDRYHDMGLEYFEKEFRDLPEDDADLELAFGELDDELEKQVSGDPHNPEFEAYKLARQQNPDYIKSYLFKIDFLRAERYNVPKAALRILRYLHEKLDLFGLDKLTRAIHWNDLGDDVVRYLKSGPLQVLPKKDARGRLVLFARGVLGDTSSKANSQELIVTARKAYFYFWSTLTEHDTGEGRLLGIVAIFWKVNDPRLTDPQLMEQVRRVWQSSPTRVSAFHLCQGPPSSASLGLVKEFAGIVMNWFRPSNDNLLPLLYSDLQLLRPHHGSVENCTKILVEYGCPQDDLVRARNPNFGGFIDGWIRERQEIDAQMQWLVDSVKTKMASASPAVSNNSIPGILKLAEEMYVAKMLVMDGSGTTTSITLQSANLRVLIELTGGGYTKFLAADREQPRLDRFATLPGHLSDNVSDDDDGLDELDRAFDVVQGLANAPKPRPLPPSPLPPPPNGSNGNNNSGLIHASQINPHDIKLGRGKPLQRHPGNMWFRNLIRVWADHYEKAERLEKTNISRDIVNIVKAQGWRFLKVDDSQKEYWREITDREAREKVSVNFRTKRKG